MATDQERRLSPGDVRSYYEGFYKSPPAEDLWHRYSRLQREQSAASFLASLPPPATRILNAGSGGISFGCAEERQHHVDLALTPLLGLSNACQADFLFLPFCDAAFDAALCIGSVINYCDDAFNAIRELSRVLKPGGKLLLEFESSKSFEYVLTVHFGKNLSPVSTFHGESGARHRLWVYSPAFLRSLLEVHGMRILSEYRYHILSPIALRLGENLALGHRLARLDRSARRFDLLSAHACNVIYSCEKCLP